MKCPYCSSMDDKVVDSRLAHDGDAVRRRRECLKCNGRFTTYEYIEEVSLVVIKSDGRREPFNRKKLTTGIGLSCKKRPISTEQIDTVVDNITQELYKQPDKEVPSKTIGMLVMDELKKLDEIAYVRFASVYKQFKDKNEFLDELKQFMQ